MRNELLTFVSRYPTYFRILFQGTQRTRNLSTRKIKHDEKAETLVLCFAGCTLGTLKRILKVYFEYFQSTLRTCVQYNGFFFTFTLILTGLGQITIDYIS